MEPTQDQQDSSLNPSGVRLPSFMKPNQPLPPAHDGDGAATADAPKPEIPPSATLYTPGAVGWATAFGGPLGGCVILALNYHRMGLKSKCTQAVLWGVLSTIALLILAFAVPDSLDPAFRGAAIGITIGLYHLSKRLQGGHVHQHRSRGGRIGSKWWGVGIGLICALLLVGTVVLWTIITYEPAGIAALANRYADDSGKHEILYSKDFSREQMISTSQLLTQIGVFSESRQASVGISREKHNTIVWLVASTAPQDRAGVRMVAARVLRSLGCKEGILRVTSPDGQQFGSDEVVQADPAH